MINWKYCPQCKNGLDRSGEYPYCKNCDLTIYQDSKPTASVLLVKDDKVLLAKRSIEPFKGMYDVIGGFLKEGEDPIVGVKREVKEETGLNIKILDFLGIYMDTYGSTGQHTFNVYYVGEITGGEMSAQEDVAELEWVPIASPPEMAFRSQDKTLKDLQKWYSKQRI
ncbi:MAG TPA: NUDIX hydrolase [Patescibacteria group bacterium]|nr:NUDIX hydrolase [Patescibacteria group bacterium]